MYGQQNGRGGYQYQNGYPQQPYGQQPYPNQMPQQYGMPPQYGMPQGSMPMQPGMGGMQPSMMPQQYGMHQQQQYGGPPPARAPPQQYSQVPQQGMSAAVAGLRHDAPVFMPGGSGPAAHAAPAARQPSLTAEEEQWLDQQIVNSSTQAVPPEAAVDDDVPDEIQQAEAAPVAEPEGGYDDVMAMIEANRKKNEEKRAAQSARNAEIVAAFEARS